MDFVSSSSMRLLEKDAEIGRDQVQDTQCPLSPPANIIINHTLDIQTPPEKVARVCFGGANNFQGSVWMYRVYIIVLFNSTNKAIIFICFKRIKEKHKTLPVSTRLIS